MKPSLPPPPRRRSALSSLPPLPTLLVILCAGFSVTLPTLYWMQASGRPCAAPPLTFTTMTFGPTEASDAQYIEHNCAVLREHRPHRYVIYATNVSMPVCRACECRQFVPVQCKCARPEKRACNHCEKVHFLGARMREWERVVFLDADLVILKEAFVGRLARRAQASDALAAVGHAKANARRFYGHLNSGLVYMRRVPGVDFGDLAKMMGQGDRNEDQGFVSEFIWRHYDNWDTLSLRWHCRFLKQAGYDIPHDECYTLHDRREAPAILAGLNFTLRTV